MNDRKESRSFFFFNTGCISQDSDCSPLTWSPVVSFDFVQVLNTSGKSNAASAIILILTYQWLHFYSIQIIYPTLDKNARWSEILKCKLLWYFSGKTVMKFYTGLAQSLLAMMREMMWPSLHSFCLAINLPRSACLEGESGLKKVSNWSFNNQSLLEPEPQKHESKPDV